MDKISFEELINIFNERIEASSYTPLIKYLNTETPAPKKSITDIKAKQFLNTQKKNKNKTSSTPSPTYKMAIEDNLNVFIPIPRDKIVGIIKDFIMQLVIYVHNSIDLPQHIGNKSEKKRANAKIKSDITTIEKYQELISHYIKPNTDTYNQLMYDTYHHNLNMIRMLKEFTPTNVEWVDNVVDLSDYTIPIIDTSKNNLKIFLEDLRIEYKLKSIKSLIDCI